MNESQRELKRAAAQAFLESLEQLGKSLGNAEAEPSQEPNRAIRSRMTRRSETTLADVDMKMWEAAAADIDRFMQTKGLQAY